MFYWTSTSVFVCYFSPLDNTCKSRPNQTTLRQSLQVQCVQQTLTPQFLENYDKK